MPHHGALFRRHAQIERAGNMQTRKIVPPVQRKLIIAPLTGNTDIEFVFMASFEEPVPNGGDLFEKIERIAVEFLGLGNSA